MATLFGTLYSTNITPDPATGIGNWSAAAFHRAMQEGVSRDGSHLFPAFPYQHFNLVTAPDLDALYAYFMTRTPVSAPALPPQIPFPLNIRALQAGWKLLFFRDDAFAQAAGKSPEWDRGAYLAEGLAHCSACHSPRNALGAERMAARRYAGAVIDEWYAPPLGAGNAAPIAWSEDELFTYLRSGATALHGSAAGAMSQVVHDGLARLPNADIHALATYFAGRFGATGAVAGTPGATAALAKAMPVASVVVQQRSDPGAERYAAACAACHYNGAATPQLLRPELALNSALTGADPSTLVQ